MLFNFFAISGILGIVFFTSAFAFEGGGRTARGKPKEEASS